MVVDAHRLVSLMDGSTPGTPGPVFSDVYAEYRSYVESALTRLGVPATDVDDLTQEVFVVLLRKIRTWDAEQSARSWLYQVARRVASNDRRRRARDQRRRQAAWAPADLEAPDEAVSRAEAAELISRFLDTLETDSRTAFLMAEVEGFGGAEIARRLGVHPQTIYSRIRAARAKFETFVRDERSARTRALALGLLWQSPVEAAPLVLRTGGRLKTGVALAALLLALVAWLATRGGEPPGGGPPAQNARPEVVSLETRSGQGGEAAFAVAGTATVSGYVRNPEGAAVPGASVCADRDVSGGPGNSFSLGYPVASSARRPARCVVTDDSGRFEVGGLYAGNTVLHAGAPGFMPARYAGQRGVAPLHLRPGDVKSDLVIVLEPGGVRVDGIVEDVLGGPIEGARLTLIEGDLFCERGAYSVASGEDGTFTLWVRPGGFRVHATATGYARTTYSYTAPGPTFRLRMIAESSIAGRVVHGDGRDAAGGTLVAAVPQPLADPDNAVIRVTETDALGRFHLAQLHPGSYELHAAAADGYGIAEGPIAVAVGQAREGVTVTLDDTVTISGRAIVGQTGEPCRAGTVHLSADGSRWSVIDGTGHVEILGVRPNTRYEVRVECEGHAVLTTELHVEAAAPEPQQWEIQPGLRLRGTVLAADDSPVPDWTVETLPEPFVGRPSGYQRAQTDDDGRFEISGLQPQLYRVMAYGPGHPTAEAVEVSISATQENTLEIRLDAATTLTGQVVTAAGDGVAGARVWALEAGRAANRAWSLNEAPKIARRSRMVSADNEGRFEMPELPPGAYDVWAARAPPVRQPAPGNLVVALMPDQGGPLLTTTLAPGEATDVTLTLDTEAESIAGRVQDAEGVAIRDAFVQVQPDFPPAPGRPAPMQSLRHFSPDATTARTGEDGAFEIGGLEPGLYSVVAVRHFGGQATEHRVRTNSSVTLTIDRGATLGGRVVTGTGDPVTGFFVTVSNEQTGLTRGSRFNADHGRWHLDGLDGGTYEIAVGSNKGHTKATGSVPQGGENLDVEITLEPYAKLEGRLVTADGAPVAREHVLARLHRDGRALPGVPTNQMTLTDDDGRFSVTAPAGTVAIHVRDLFSAPVTIVDAPAGKTLELGDLRVAQGSP